MEKTYSIHPSIFLMEKVMYRLSFGIIIVIISGPLFLTGPFIIVRYVLLKIALFISVALLSLNFLFRMIFKDLKKTQFHLSSAGIQKVSQYTASAIKLDHITRISFTTIPFITAFCTIKSQKTKLYLHTTIDDTAGLLTYLYTLLKNIGKESLINQVKMNSFIQNAHISDFHAKQTDKIIIPLIGTIFIFSALSGFVSIKIWQLPFFYSFIWTIAGFIFPIIGYCTSYMLISSILRKQPMQTDHPENSVHIHSIYRTISILTVLLYLCTGIAYKYFCVYFYL